jgi:hypothetical protein
VGRQLGVRESSCCFQEGHIREWLVGLRAGEHELTTEGLYLREQCDRSIRERDTMFFAAFHADARNRPRLVVQIDFRPSGESYFVRAGRRQNQELEPTAHRVLHLGDRLQCGDECGHRLIRQRSEMLLVAFVLRQNLRQPLRGIV